MRILIPLIKQLTEAAITAELEHHLVNDEERTARVQKTLRQVQAHLNRNSSKSITLS